MGQGLKGGLVAVPSSPPIQRYTRYLTRENTEYRLLSEYLSSCPLEVLAT